MSYLKRIPFQTIKNARDLGGFQTLDKKITCWGKIFRTANMDDINDYDIKLLKEMNISTIIDLRRDEEIKANHKNIDKVRDNFIYKHVSLSKGFMRDEEIKKILERKITIASTYYDLIDNYKSVKEILEIIINCKEAVLFHCQEGKDRTGIITMILYWILNVERCDIIADYEISSANLGYVERYDENELYSIFRITNPYTIKDAYAYITRKYHSPEEYFEYAKIDKTLIEKLKEKMLE